jgi:hypothetical protein
MLRRKRLPDSSELLLQAPCVTSWNSPQTETTGADPPELKHHEFAYGRSFSMVITYLALFFFLLGLILYLAPTPAKWSEVGRIFLFAGTLALCLFAGQEAVKVF